MGFHSLTAGAYSCAELDQPSVDTPLTDTTDKPNGQFRRGDWVAFWQGRPHGYFTAQLGWDIVSHGKPRPHHDDATSSFALICSSSYLSLSFRLNFFPQRRHFLSLLDSLPILYLFSGNNGQESSGTQTGLP